MNNTDLTLDHQAPQSGQIRKTYSAPTLVDLDAIGRKTQSQSSAANNELAPNSYTS